MVTNRWRGYFDYFLNFRHDREDERSYLGRKGLGSEGRKEVNIDEEMKVLKKMKIEKFAGLDGSK